MNIEVSVSLIGRDDEVKVYGELDDAILAEGKPGLAKVDVCCKDGISNAINCQWKSKFAGVSDTNAKRIKDLKPRPSSRPKHLSSLLTDNGSCYTSNETRNLARVLDKTRNKS